MITPAAAGDRAVTIVATRRVRRGHEAAYEAALEALLRDATVFAGYRGTEVQRPTPGAATPTYTSVFRFDSVAHLQAFEASERRRRFLHEVAPHVEADATWDRLTGLEVWFTAPPGTIVPQPSRARMALLMIGVVYGLVLSLGALVGAVLGGAPAPARLLVTITIEVLLMTYVLMPRLTRWLARWIYPSPPTPRGT